MFNVQPPPTGSDLALCCPSSELVPPQPFHCSLWKLVLLNKCPSTCSLGMNTPRPPRTAGSAFPLSLLGGWHIIVPTPRVSRVGSGVGEWGVRVPGLQREDLFPVPSPLNTLAQRGLFLPQGKVWCHPALSLLGFQVLVSSPSDWSCLLPLSLLPPGSVLPFFLRDCTLDAFPLHQGCGPQNISSYSWIFNLLYIFYFFLSI